MSNIEIKALLNQCPMCLFHQPMVALMLRDPVVKFQKNFDHYYRSGARLLVQRVNPHKLTSNACQVTFFLQF